MPRFTLLSLDVDDLDVALLRGDLVVVRRAESDQLDWELVATSPPREPIPQAPCRLTMTMLEGGRLLRGDAVVVRSDEQRHVFRGVGDLDGLRTSDGLEPEV